MGVTLYEAKGADLSPCGRYRYSLRRRWFTASVRGRNRHVCWIMLNPSTADSDTDDATIRRCVGYSFRWGFASLEVVNLFAWRATDPRDLRRARDPVGNGNNVSISTAALTADLVVCAWGVFGYFMDRGATVQSMLQDYGIKLNALGHTKGGQPRHPLRLAYRQPLVSVPSL